MLTTVRADHFDTILTQDAGTTGLDQPVGAGATTLRKIIGGLRRPKSLGICLPDGLFADLDLPEHDEPSAIGAPDDYRRYNDEPW